MNSSNYIFTLPPLPTFNNQFVNKKRECYKGKIPNDPRIIEANKILKELNTTVVEMVDLLRIYANFQITKSTLHAFKQGNVKGTSRKVAFDHVNRNLANLRIVREYLTNLPEISYLFKCDFRSLVHIWSVQCGFFGGHSTRLMEVTLRRITQGSFHRFIHDNRKPESFSDLILIHHDIKEFIAWKYQNQQQIVAWINQEKKANQKDEPSSYYFELFGPRNKIGKGSKTSITLNPHLLGTLLC
jgi:hypothetical protein